MAEENVDCATEFYEDGKKSLKELRRRINITYRTRIIAADRMRNKNAEYKKLNIYYSVLVTGLSIISIGNEYKILNIISVSNTVLMFSIVLTYFMFYTSEKNLQERAYKMEETFKKLDRLKNKIDITLIYDSEIGEDKCKKLYQDYERILNSIENHEQIDYYKYRLGVYKNEGIESNQQLIYNEINKKVKAYEFWRKVLLFAKYVMPAIIALILIISFIVKL